MTTYNTRTLAEALIGDDTKAATRTVRKFLRDELGEGKAVVGKGGRYSLDYNKRDLTALAKRFKAWEAQQEEDKAKRAADLAAKGAIILPADDSTDEEALAANEESDKGVEGPSDEEIAEMLSDEEEMDDEVEEDNEA